MIADCNDGLIVTLYITGEIITQIKLLYVADLRLAIKGLIPFDT
jgi:hypothetical protein